MVNYPEYSKFHISTNPLKSKLIHDYIIPGKILDIGCGNGLYALDCKPELNEITQLDIIDRRSDVVNSFEFIKADIESYTLEPSSIDTIIAFDIIEHLNDDFAFIQKAYIQLKKGGRILISVPNEDNSLLEKLNLAHIHFTDKTHRREYSQLKLKSLLENCGFKVVSISPNLNNAVLNFSDLFINESLFSKLSSKFFKVIISTFIFLGIFNNRVIADWFIVGEK